MASQAILCLLGCEKVMGYVCPLLGVGGSYFLCLATERAAGSIPNF